MLRRILNLFIKSEWLGDYWGDECNDWYCKKCGSYYPEQDKELLGNYCPNCGLKMRKR